ncbi:FkbM family methyltransferase [Poriferisphaera corsica]|nr:FkbM family methyltransferase [Poriferisphaera corsica]
MQRGEFELDEIAVLGKLLDDVDVFVDVGANIGYFSCFARNRGVKVVAIEPLQKNFQHLCENMYLNGWDDIDLFSFGLSDRRGVEVMYGASSTGASFIEKWAGASSKFKRFAAMTTLDRLIEEEYLGSKHLIKMDIEGYEYHALRGANRVIEGDQESGEKPIWLIEITMNEYHPDGVNPCFLRTFELFFESGYRCLLLDENAEEVDEEMVKTWVKERSTGRLAVNYLFVAVGRFEEVVGKIKSIEYQLG